MNVLNLKLGTKGQSGSGQEDIIERAEHSTKRVQQVVHSAGLNASLVPRPNIREYITVSCINQSIVDLDHLDVDQDELGPYNCGSGINVGPISTGSGLNS